MQAMAALGGQAGQRVCLFGGSGRVRIGDDGYVVILREQIHGGLVDADVGLDAAEQDLPARQRFELDVERLVAGATEAGLVDRLDAAQQFGDLWHGRPQGLRRLLAPENGDLQNPGRLDEDAGVLEEGFFVGHQLGELALDVDDDEAALIDFEHSVALRCRAAGRKRLRAPPAGHCVLRRTIVMVVCTPPWGGAGIALVAGSFESQSPGISGVAIIMVVVDLQIPRDLRPGIACEAVFRPRPRVHLSRWSRRCPG